MSVSIRTYEDADEPAVIRLWRECGLVVPWNDPQRDIARKRVWQADWFLVAHDRGEVIGSVMAGYDGHRGWINYLAVCLGRRGEGIGRMLMQEAEDRLGAVGCPKINLQVRVSNEAVVPFYEKLGYAQDACVSLGKRLAPDRNCGG